MRYESTQLNRSVVSLSLSNEKYYRFKNTHCTTNNNDRTAIFYYDDDIGFYFMLLKFHINTSKLVILIIIDIINIFTRMLLIFWVCLPNFQRREYI